MRGASGARNNDERQDKGFHGARRPRSLSASTVSRRTFLGGMAAGGAALLLPPGRANALAKRAVLSRAPGAVRGGSLVVGENSDEPNSLDPHATADTNTTITLRPIFDSLLWQDAQGAIQPWLAESWTISTDGKIYTFKLRPGVTFHDGSTWDAAALQANLDHMVDPATKSPLAASYIAQYTGSRVVSEDTLEVHLSQAYNSFLDVLAQSYLSMISPKQIKEAPDEIGQHPIGSGPFIFGQWRQGENITYTRNPKYNWGPPGSNHTGPAYLDNLTIEFITEDATRYDALASGQVDIIDNTPPQDVDQVKADSQLGFTQHLRPGHPFSIWFNTSKFPFNDQAVRQALFYGVDRATILRNVSFGQWDLASGFLSTVTPDYSHELASKFVYDVAKANSLLDKAGWTSRDSGGYRTKDGKRLAAVWPDPGVVQQTTQIIEQVQAEAKKLGIQLIYKTGSEDAIDTLEEKGDYNVTSGIWTTNTPDVLWILYDSHNITTPARLGQNSSYLDNATVDKLVQAARQTTSSATRQELYNQAQEVLFDLAPAIPIYNRASQVSYNKTKVHDVTFENAYGALIFYDTWLA